MGILDTLLSEDFNPGEPRGFHGKWIGNTTDGSAALRVMHGSTVVGDVPHNENRTQMMLGVGRVVGDSGRTISTQDIGSVVDRVRRSLPPSGQEVRVARINPKDRGAHDRDVDNSIANQRSAQARGLDFGQPARIPRASSSAQARNAAYRRTRGLTEGVGLDMMLEAFAPPSAPAVTPAQSTAAGAAQVTAAQAQLAGWDATKHPRGVGGKFGYTTGGKRATQGKHSTTRVVDTGARGTLVASIQKQLGITGGGGEYGARTKAAVTAYQRQHGLTVDGVVGRQTLAALRGHSNPSKVAPGPIASKAATVTVHPAQRELRLEAQKVKQLERKVGRLQRSHTAPPANRSLGGDVI